MSTWRPLMSCRSVKRETKDDMPGMGWQESRVFLCHTDVPTSHLPPQWATVLTSAFCFTPQAGCHLPPRPSSLLQFSGSGEFLDWFANMDVDISHRKGQWYKSQCVHYAFRNTHTHPTHTHRIHWYIHIHSVLSSDTHCLVEVTFNVDTPHYDS